MTPLIVASYEGKAETVQLLLNKGANIHAEDYKGRQILKTQVFYTVKYTVFHSLIYINVYK